VAHFLPHLGTVPDQSVTLFPAWYAATAPDWPQPLLRGGFPLFDPAAEAALPAAVQAFLAAGTAPVVLTLGTFQRHGGPVLAQLVAAVRALGRRALVLAADRAQLPLPDAHDLLWQPYVPLRLLLPRAAALLHHGGIGTTAEALRAGVPQLVLPWAFDQFDNAQRVRALGVGLSLPPRRLRAGPLRDALQQLLGRPGLAAACREAAGRLAADPGPDAICQAIWPAWGIDPAQAWQGPAGLETCRRQPHVPVNSEDIPPCVSTSSPPRSSKRWPKASRWPSRATTPTSNPAMCWRPCSPSPMAPRRCSTAPAPTPPP
jgi:rhamnosyltransferase subunit B